PSATTGRASRKGTPKRSSSRSIASTRAATTERTVKASGSRSPPGSWSCTAARRPHGIARTAASRSSWSCRSRRLRERSATHERSSSAAPPFSRSSRARWCIHAPGSFSLAISRRRWGGVSTAVPRGHSRRHRPPRRRTALRGRSNRLIARLAGADAVHLLELRDEDLAVTDLAGLRRLDDRLDDPLDELVGDRDLDLHLRQEIYDVLRAAVELRVAALTPETLHLGNRHALDADLGERIADIVQAKRLDDGGNQLHRTPLSVSYGIFGLELRPGRGLRCVLEPDSVAESNRNSHRRPPGRRVGAWAPDH